ncbi:MAG: methionyl-tRNA formyltransferase [Planctomycetaceae bacterium]|nr:methionyl-tRNA formyltransferase [Planctomycetaceae bacterium]
MSQSRSIVLFADEVGIPLALASAGAGAIACVVVDPKRATAVAAAEQACRPLAIPVLAHPSPQGRREFEAAVGDLSASLGLVVSYNRILWPDLLGLFPRGVVNLHGSRLPQYRGANVLQWAIINGETQTAMTMHYVDQGVDTGAIIAQRDVPIAHADTALAVREKLMSAAAALLEEYLPRLVCGRLSAHAQDEALARVWPRRRPQDGRIDWSWSDRKIHDLIRALVRPWPGAFYRDRAGQDVTIDRYMSLGEIAALRREVGS